VAGGKGSGVSADQSARAATGALLLSSDSQLCAEVARLAATVDAPLAVADVVTARLCWEQASVVLVGDDMAAQLIGLRLPRREHVHLVTTDVPGEPAWRMAMALGAEGVVSVPRDRASLVEVLAARSRATAGALVCVLGACGGAGASVFAAGLAASAGAAGRSSALVDADGWGGGADLIFGAEEVSGLRWPDLAAASGHVSSSSLREVLPVIDGVSVLSWGRAEPVPVSAGSMRTVLSAASGGHTLTVVDLSRHLDPAGWEALGMATAAVVVVPAQLRAVAAVRARLNRVRQTTGDVRLVVRKPPSGGVSTEQVVDALGVPLAVSMRDERGLSGWLDQGLGPFRSRRGQLSRACAEVLVALAGEVPPS
jgi:secretion/DNA translocation related CpaE-like protein